MNTPFYQLRWQQLHHPMLATYRTELWICHVDCAIQAAVGNKWLKLKYHIQQIQQYDQLGIVTFGGAFSNHLAAVAAAGKAFGFRTKALVRSHSPDLNPTLRQCAEDGMELIFVDAPTYRQRSNPKFLQQLAMRYPGFYIVPEGGTNRGCCDGFMQDDFSQTPNGRADLIVCASASGGTIAGICHQQQHYQRCPVLGIQVVKDGSLADKITELCPDMHDLWQLLPEHSGQKYGSFDEHTLNFCLEMAKYGVGVEPIYTGKALHTLFQQIDNHSQFHAKRITFFHTGGMQGLHGLHYRHLLTAQQYQSLTKATPFGHVPSVQPTVD